MTPKPVPCLMIRLTADDRAKLEAVRRKLGERSAAAAIRAMIKITLGTDKKESE